MVIPLQHIYKHLYFDKKYFWKINNNIQIIILLYVYIVYFKYLQINLLCYHNLILYNHINSILGVISGTSVPKRCFFIILTLWFGVVIYNYTYLILGHLVFHECFGARYYTPLRFQDKWRAVISSLVARPLMMKVTDIYGRIWMRRWAAGNTVSGENKKIYK